MVIVNDMTNASLTYSVVQNTHNGITLPSEVHSELIRGSLYGNATAISYR